MRSVFMKRISILVSIPGLFLAVSVLGQTAQAQGYSGEGPREANTRAVFGTKVVEGLSQLSPTRFEGAREHAMNLAQKVKDHELSVKQARDALLAVLVKMERGESLASLPDPAFEIVGVMPVGEAAAGHDVPGADISMVASAPKAEEPDSAEEPALDSAPSKASAPRDEISSASDSKAAPESLDFPEPTSAPDSHAASDDESAEQQRHVSSI